MEGTSWYWKACDTRKENRWFDFPVHFLAGFVDETPKWTLKVSNLFPNSMWPCKTWMINYKLGLWLNRHTCSTSSSNVHTCNSMLLSSDMVRLSYYTGVVLALFPGPAQLSVACSSPAFSYCKRQKAGRGLGTRLVKLKSLQNYCFSIHRVNVTMYTFNSVCSSNGT